ncbi:SusC/RagA family TonB-linked outer membrane protein [Pedobacter psychroterrae]|uniref:SusC/RagA family TonB-linked outer membrane protein n=1 Tax=Pedobacter psychroterrae TaxID=2530453 RepID=A0A4R0NTJ0_9SPHI|nr:SusC/RagA family TonB-linked outer membrane protein [Pedobacter psychroterrae]TCD02765.1 SusC/RagA family TonB-linked outer membrane protein [Pedobacter psychroterrae]
MKLTAILLLIGTLHLSAASYSQSVTISRKNTTLETVFKDIKKQTGYLFFYNGKVSLTDQTLNVEFKNVPLEEALKACLAQQNLTYNIVDKTIVIRKLPSSQAVDGNAVRYLEITGKVIDNDTDQPVPGVNIAIKADKLLRGQTNQNGEFKVTAQVGDILVFTYIGFKTKEITVADGKPLVVRLETEVNTIDAVVVTGYQTIKKESFTGNAITMTGAQLKMINPQNILASIGAYDPSFRLMQNNLAGSNPNRIPSINVRGSSALPSGDGEVLRRDNFTSGANTPVFIMDGYEVNAQKVFDLDVNRIESVTLLKDAASTAIYGSRGANGVLVITTRAPKAGKLRVDYNYELNVTGADLSDYQVLNAKEKMEYEKLALIYDGGKQSMSQDYLDELYYHNYANVVGGVNTYWLSQPVRTTAGNKHAVNVDGGSEAFRYGVDLRYQTRPGVMKGSSRDQFSGGMNFIYNLKKLQFRNELTVMQVNATESPYGDFKNYVRMNPYYPMMDANGRYVQIIDAWQKQDRSYDYVYNPLYDAQLSSFNKNAYSEIIDNLSADLQITKDLSLRGQMSLTSRSFTDDRFTSPNNSKYYEYETEKIDEKGEYYSGQRKETRWDGNVRLTWLKQLGGSFFNVTGLINVIEEINDSRDFTAIGFANDRFTSIGFAKGYAEEGKPNSSYKQSRLFGSAVMANYSFKNRYLLDASVRIDGSSKFGVENRLAPFWSAGIGWNVHQEEFLKDHPVISQLRLKATTGLTGSVEFDPYLSRTTYQYNTGNWYSSGIGAIVNNYGNQNLSWQKTRMVDFSIDLSLFKDRLKIEPRIYRKFTKDILASITLPPSTGFLSYKENLGDMENKGAELNLSWEAIRTNDISLSFRGAFVTNRNKILRISNALKKYEDKADEEQSKPESEGGYKGIPLLRYREGQSINTIYGVPSLGIDPENGRELYRKLDGTLTYDYDKRDYVPIGNPDPRLEGSFGGSFRYKSWGLFTNFRTKFGGEDYNLTLVQRVENADPRYNVDRRVFEGKWRESGDRTFYKNISDIGETEVNSRFIQDDNLVNLETVQLSFNLDQKYARRLRMNNLDFTLTANDVVRWSSIKEERGIDYPFARSITFGIRAGF